MGVVLAGLVLPNVQNHSLASLGGALRRAGSRMTSSRSAAGATSSRPWRGARRGDLRRHPLRRFRPEHRGGAGVDHARPRASPARLSRAHRLRRPFREPERCRHPERGFRRSTSSSASPASRRCWGWRRGRARRSSWRRCRERSFAATTAPFGSARPPGRSRRFRAPCTATSCRSISASAQSIWWAAAAARRTAATVASRRPRASPPPRQGAPVMDRRMTRRLGRRAMDERPAGQPRSPPSITRGRHGFSR